MATLAQKAAVALALVAAALSFVAVGIRFSERGELGLTPLAGGVFMLALGISGVFRLRQARASSRSSGRAPKG